MAEPKVKSLYKALQIFNCFDGRNPELGVTEIARRTGMLKSSVHNIMQTFEQCGFVEKNSATSKYTIGNTILALGNIKLANSDLRSVLQPNLKKISNLTNENSYFVIPSGTSVMYISAICPGDLTRNENLLGFKAPMYCTGVGKAVMAFLGEEKLNEVINQGLKAYTENTIIDHQRLREEMEIIRKRGYAIDNMEHEYGVKCVAVPIFNTFNKAIGSISVSGPSPRFDDDKIKLYSKYLTEVADSVKNLLR